MMNEIEYERMQEAAEMGRYIDSVAMTAQFRTLAAAQEFCRILQCSGYGYSILEAEPERWVVRHWPDAE